MGGNGAPRRRRSHEEAEREILGAAGAFLEEHPFRELTIEELMSRTGLSRSAFYAYFRDRYELITRILEEIGGLFFEAERHWLEEKGGDGRSRMRETVRAGVRIFARYGPVLRAIADAASYDPEVERAYRSGLIEGFVEAVADRIRDDIAEGLVPGDLDPDQVARALVWMTERYALDALGVRPARSEPEVVSKTLEEVWIRTLYGA